MTRVSGYSEIVGAQLRHVGDGGDAAAFDDDQAGFGQFVQDARKMFLREVETRRDDAFVGRERHRQRGGVGIGRLAQQITDDARWRPECRE